MILCGAACARRTNLSAWVRVLLSIAIVSNATAAPRIYEVSFLPYLAVGKSNLLSTGTFGRTTFVALRLPPCKSRKDRNERARSGAEVVSRS